MDNELKAFDVGTFNVTSGVLVATDPCYESSMDDTNAIKKVKNGKWMCFVVHEHCGEHWGDRIKRLCINHESFDDDENALWEPCDFTVGVDSGQAGFFDGAIVHKTHEELYHVICESSRDGMVGENYAVSSSGFGDGGYECAVTRNKDGEVVAAMIEFIEDEEILENEEFEPDSDIFAEDDEFIGDPD
jgi:hypothetical protein